MPYRSIDSDSTKPTRQLLVIADDFGIGSATTEGILHLASRGVITGSVMLVNSPAAEDSVRRWIQLGSNLELGWHPNLTLDQPLALPEQIPSLVQPNGLFWPLPQFLKRWLFGRFQHSEIRMELRLQLERFIDLVGHPPAFVNFHQHLALFSPVGQILMDVLGGLRYRPYIRRVREPWSAVVKLPGARLKRIFLGALGRRASRLQERGGFPGNDWLAGIGNPGCIADPTFFVRRIRSMPGQILELMCHPGLRDESLIGRDCTETDGLLEQRVHELQWLGESSFREAVEAAGFTLTKPSEVVFGSVSQSQCS